MELEGNENFATEQHLEDWVIEKCDSWRDHFEANYSQRFEEYYRLWRGQWSPQDRTRDTERSKIISPALQQAVESSVAELEEATFGRGKWFDIKDDIYDQDPNDIALLRNALEQDFKKNKVRKKGQWQRPMKIWKPPLKLQNFLVLPWLANQHKNKLQDLFKFFSTWDMNFD